MAQPPTPKDPRLTLDGINGMAPRIAVALMGPVKKVNANEELLDYPQLVNFLSTNVPVPNIDLTKLPVVTNPHLDVPIGQKVIYPPTPITRVSFLNRVALIVGGSKNIGKAIATYLHTRGYIVIATSRNPSVYTKSENPLLCPVQLDVRDQTSVDRFFDKVIKPLGRLDYLINCAGIHWKGTTNGMASDDMKAYMQIKPIGFHRCVYAALPYLRKHSDSRVLCFSSIAGGQNLYTPGSGLYNVVNHALTMYTYQCNIDERFMYAFGAIENPVTFVCITPGVILSTIGSYDHGYNKTSISPAISYASHVVVAAAQTGIVPGFTAEVPETVARQVHDIISAPQPGFNYIVGNPNEMFGPVPLVTALQLSNQMPDYQYTNSFINPLTVTFFNNPAANGTREGLKFLYS